MLNSRQTNYYVEIALSQVIFFAPLLFFGFIMGHLYTIIFSLAGIIISVIYPILNRNKKFEFITGTRFLNYLISTLAVVMTFLYGWNACYYIYLFEILSLIFMNSFLDNLKKKKNTIMLPIMNSIILGVLFVLIKTMTLFYEPFYKLSERMVHIICYANCAIVFISVPVFASRYSRQIVKAINTLKSNALLDELTGLYNRRAIRPYLDLYLTEYNTKGLNFGIAIFDIDDFKHINDKYGHNEGDKVLVRFADILKENISDTTNIARWGGEEFIVLQQYGAKDYLTFVNLIETIASRISKETFYPSKGKEYSITVTAGCSHSLHNISIKDLINRADIRLYKGKNAGKNVTVYQ